MTVREFFAAKGSCGEIAYEMLLLLKNTYPFRSMYELQYLLGGTYPHISVISDKPIICLPGLDQEWNTDLKEHQIMYSELRMPHCQEVMPKYNIDYAQVNLRTHIVRVICHEWAHLLQRDGEHGMNLKWHEDGSELEAESWAWNFISCYFHKIELARILTKEDLPSEFLFKQKINKFQLELSF